MATQLRSVVRALIQIATGIVLIFAMFIVYFGITTQIEKSKAEVLCQALPIGTDLMKAQQVIATAGKEPYLYFESPGHISNGFYGALKERWICSAAISSGKSVEVRPLD